VGSTLVIRSTGNVHPDVVTTGGLTDPKTAGNTTQGTEERRFTVGDAGSATVRGVGASDVTWQFTAIPDRPPTIALAKDPEPQARGTLLLSYKLEDDYGVTEAKATFTLKQPDAKGGQAAPRPLYDAPEFALSLPQARTRNGVGQTTKDLTEHPWAGASVVMTLTARDDGGNEGHSEPYEFALPQRPFYKPLARALIEQRRDLALDANARDRVLIALDALAMAPETFTPETSVYLGLRSIFFNLASAKSDDDLRGVVKRLWEMATEIEDGNVAGVEAALRQAQENLRQAIENGASEEEIKRLTEQLRAALDKYLQALAEQMQKNPQSARPRDPNAKMLSQRDLQNMIDRVARSMQQVKRLEKILAEQQQLRDRAGQREGAQLGPVARDQGKLLQYLKRQIDQIPN
jgi:uncharacterized protein (TIGR02302 family)